MSEGRRVTELGSRNPSIALTPLPTGTGSTLQPLPQIRGGHRINVDADILGEETRQGLQTSTFKIGNSGGQQNTPAPTPTSLRTKQYSTPEPFRNPLRKSCGQ